jgi:hypothetical protein
MRPDEANPSGDISRWNIAGEDNSDKGCFGDDVSDKDLLYQVIFKEKKIRCLSMGYSIREKERIKNID